MKPAQAKYLIMRMARESSFFTGALVQAGAWTAGGFPDESKSKEEILALAKWFEDIAPAVRGLVETSK